MQPGSRLGPYEIIAPIGAGGMGEVYRARDTRLGREVAIKVLPAEFAADAERLKRFEREAKTTAALSHPNILDVHDVGTVEGVPYLVEELLEGESLGRAKVAAMRAIELDDTLVEAHLVLATVLFLHDWDWAGAQRHFDLTHRLPGGTGFGRLGFSFYQLLAGDPHKALQEARRGAEQEPLSPIAQTQAAAGHIAVGDIESAVVFLEKALELDSEMPMALVWLGFCRGVQGRLEEAITLLRSAVDRGLMAGLMFLPQILVRAGKKKEAGGVVAALEQAGDERYVSPLVKAFALAAVGEKDLSVPLLEQAEAERSAMFTLCAFAPGYLKLVPSGVVEWFATCRERIRPGGALLTTTPDPGKPDWS